MTTYSLKTLRTLALHTQCLTDPTANSSIYDTIHQILCVQIDTLQMVQRSQYLTLWSRLGQYDTAEFDALIYGENRQLFEYWLHAASIIPLADYRYRIPFMKREITRGSQARFLREEFSAQIIEATYQRIQDEGALRSADFKDDGHKGSSWWGWKPSKRALEYLYDQGQLMIADRVNFQRIYNLTERVLPDWVDTTQPTDEEMYLHFLERSALALGVCQPMQVADYTYIKRGTARPLIEGLIKDGTFIEIQGELADGTTADLVIHRDNLSLLGQIADGAIQAVHTTFLSPFDSLFWASKRDQQFWNFEQTLEAYKPSPQRKWGYFCLPILHHDRLIGRFDPKLERKTGTLRLKALHLEPGIDPDEGTIADVATAMRDFMVFHNASDLVIEADIEFGRKLMAGLGFG